MNRMSQSTREGANARGQDGTKKIKTPLCMHVTYTCIHTENTPLVPLTITFMKKIDHINFYNLFMRQNCISCCIQNYCQGAKGRPDNRIKTFMQADLQFWFQLTMTEELTYRGCLRRVASLYCAYLPNKVFYKKEIKPKKISFNYGLVWS